MPPFFFSALPPHSTGTSMPTPLYIPHLLFPANFNSMAGASSSLSSSPFLSATTLCHHPCGGVWVSPIMWKKKIWNFATTVSSEESALSFPCWNSYMSEFGKNHCPFFFLYRLSRPLRSPPLFHWNWHGAKRRELEGCAGKNFTSKRDGEEDRMEEEGFLLSQYRKQGWGKFDRHFRWLKNANTVYVYKSLQWTVSVFSFQDPVANT